MSTVLHSFVLLVHKHFDYLQRDFGFSTTDRIGEGWVESAEVRYDSPTVAITPYWNSRDGVGIQIIAKEDTFWIRPASSHEFDVQELAQMFPPEASKAPPVAGWPEGTEDELDAWLRYYAGHLRTYAQSLLQGDLSACEDMLIMRYCNSTKGLPREEYIKVFREETSALSEEERQQVEAAIASGSPRCLCFLLDEWVQGGRLRGERFLTALNDFRIQYLQ